MASVLKHESNGNNSVCDRIQERITLSKEQVWKHKCSDEIQIVERFAKQVKT